MIAKVSRRIADGSFGRLAAYVSDMKKIGDLRDWRRTADYILDQKGGGDRVASIRVSNCQYDEPGMALAEIAATQECNTGSKVDKTYHLIVSFPPGEKPTAAQLHDIEDRLCGAIGLADHQRISAVHNDKDHFHFHVAINKVHPTSLRAITPYFDQSRLQAACIDLEQKHGLTRTNHQMPEPGRPKGTRDRAERMELHGKQQSLNQWVREEAGPALLKAQESGKGWQDLHRAVAGYGLEVKPRGAGLVISVTGDKYARVKPSDIDRRLSFGALTEKWGAYQAPKGPQPAPERVYPRAPLHIASPNTAELFKSFQHDRQRSIEERKTNRETARSTSKAYREELAAWALERRQAIKQMPFSAYGRCGAYAELKQLRTEALQQERERAAEEQRQVRAAPLPTWQSWLEAQAASGNGQALEVLRSTEQRKAQLGDAVLKAGDADQARHVVYQHLRSTIGKDGTVTYRVADGGRVTDRAQHVSVDAVSTAASFLALTLAVDKYAGKPLVVNGTDEFKQQIAELAAVHGFHVRFADPAMEAERQRQADSLHVPPPREPDAPLIGGPTVETRPEVLGFIEGRNKTRQRGVDILPHRAWTPKDAGPASYVGRRNLSGGIEVLLLSRRGETLVKVVTPNQAARASTWSIGDDIRMDERGRVLAHQAKNVRDEPDQQPDRER